MRTKLRLNSGRARSFAETRWGRGGTHSYRTNRHGAYYYSCSGHGGYVVDGLALSEAERAAIDPYVKPENVFFAERPSEGCYFLQNIDSFRSQRYQPYADTVTGKTPIYFFEEDCDWAVLEKFTDIRSAGHVDTPEHHAATIEATFNRWHTPEGRAALDAQLAAVRERSIA